jgi:hypothetical protein
LHAAFGTSSEVALEAALGMLRDAAEFLLPCMSERHAAVLYEACGKALKVRWIVLKS